MRNNKELVLKKHIIEMIEKIEEESALKVIFNIVHKYFINN